MIVETRTSTYELTAVAGVFKLKKTGIKLGSTSAVSVGREFTGNAYLALPDGDAILVVGNMHTSPVRNKAEVAAFLKQHGGE